MTRFERFAPSLVCPGFALSLGATRHALLAEADGLHLITHLSHYHMALGWVRGRTLGLVEAADAGVLEDGSLTVVHGEIRT